MFRKHFYLLLLFFCFTLAAKSQDSCGLRVSVLTCGVGEELYSVYGHSAVRIIDSCKGSDIVYNYGTFNFSDPDFYIKFTRGKLLYYLNDEDFSSFMGLYVYEKRSVTEQVLNLSRNDALAVQHFLQNNLKEENKYYKYDFLFDNCSTRIRDLFANVFKGRIQFANIISNDSVSFRTLLNHYERNLHWERVGINILMSNLVDKKMKSYESMFLPDYLLRGFDNATLDGNKVVASSDELLPSGIKAETPLNEPRVYFWILFAVILLASLSKKMQLPLKIFDILFFAILGMLGLLILFMWFGTEHKVCAYNLNLFWAFPLHLVFAYLISRNSSKAIAYAKTAFYMLIAALIYNYFADQKYIKEITPLILLILWRLSFYSQKKTLG